MGKAEKVETNQAKPVKFNMIYQNMIYQDEILTSVVGEEDDETSELDEETEEEEDLE